MSDRHRTTTTDWGVGIICGVLTLMVLTGVIVGFFLGRSFAAPLELPPPVVVTVPVPAPAPSTITKKLQIGDLLNCMLDPKEYCPT